MTIIAAGDAKAIKKFSAFLAVDTPKKGYWTTRYMGKGPDSMMPMQQLDDLESDSGDTISYDLNMQMTMQPVEGDDVLENKEERLKFYTDEVKILQLRGGINSGGRMSRKRTKHQLRTVGKKRQSEWWARVFDELSFMYGSGSRGINSDFVYPIGYAGFGGNAITAPDSDHIIYAGKKTKATITSSDVTSLGDVDRLVAKAGTMGGGAGSGAAGTDGNLQTPQIQPIPVEGGGNHYVLLMHEWQEYDLRTGLTPTGGSSWMDIQKALATNLGTRSPIAIGGSGMHNGVVLQKHRNVIRFSDYGAGTNLPAARALFLGSQALVVAFGSPGTGLRYSWNESTRDNGNQLIITSSTIVGIKKCTYNGKDFGVIAYDTYCVNPG
jgi:N4-gp56 family major capsid protein